MTCHLTPTGGDLRANIEGLLKKFRVTRENEKESEIFTLANLDNGCIRKFIVKKVDESAFLASINRRNKEDSKSLTDENENTAVVGSEEGGDGCLLVPPSPTLPRRNVDAQPIANGHATPLQRKSSSNFKLGCDDDSDDNSMTVEDKDDPGVINPAFSYEEDDDLGRGDGSTTSARSSPDASPLQSPKLNFSSMSPRPSPRHSPVSHRSGNLSHRSSVSSVRKGILKKSGSSSTINMEMVNLGLQNAAIAAGNVANLNGYQRARFTDPYDDNFVPMDTHRFVGSSEENNYAMQQKSLGGHRVKFILETGKPDHVHGSYDDIRIEKMERERIERIESAPPLAHGMPPLTPPNTPPLHSMTSHSLASLGSAAQHRHPLQAPPPSACLPDLVPPSPKGPRPGQTDSSPPPKTPLPSLLQTDKEDDDEIRGTNHEPPQCQWGEASLQERGEASLQEQRRELRALLLQDLANFRQGHGYLMAKELEEKVAALRLSKSVLHRVKILQYLRLRERHSGSLHPSLLADGPDTLPPSRRAHLKRPGGRVGLLCGNSSQERGLAPIPEEDMQEETLGQDHLAEYPQVTAGQVEATQHDVTRLEGQTGEATGEGGETPHGDLPTRPCPASARRYERPSVKRRFLKKNEKLLPEGHAATLERTSEGPLRVSSVSHQYLTSDRDTTAEPHGSTLGKMVLKIEINCVSPWGADATRPPQSPDAAVGVPSAPAAGRHSTVTDIVLDAAPQVDAALAAPAKPPDGPHSLAYGPKDVSILVSTPHQSPPVTAGSSAGSEEALDPKVMCQDLPAPPRPAPPDAANEPCTVSLPAVNDKGSPPRLLSSGPTDYLTWAAEVTREEASRLGSPGIPA